MECNNTTLPTPHNLVEITAGIVKNDMSTYDTLYPIRSYSEAYLEGKKQFSQFARNSRKRGASPDFEGGPSSSQQQRPGPSHMITGIQITATIIPMQPSTSAPPSSILSEWINIVKHDMETMSKLRKPASNSDAYLYYVSPHVRKMVFAQKINNPLKSLKDSVIKTMGADGQRIAEAIDKEEEIKESLRFSLAKKMKNLTYANPDCTDSLRENVNAIFK